MRANIIWRERIVAGIGL